MRLAEALGYKGLWGALARKCCRAGSHKGYPYYSLRSLIYEDFSVALGFLYPAEAGRNPLSSRNDLLGHKCTPPPSPSFRLEFCLHREAFKPNGAGITQWRNLRSKCPRSLIYEDFSVALSFLYPAEAGRKPLTPHHSSFTIHHSIHLFPTFVQNMTAPKKQYGQHFLRAPRVAEEISDSLRGIGTAYTDLLEIGPGEGVLTDHLYKRYGKSLTLVEIDADLIPPLKVKYPDIRDQIIQGDFLDMKLGDQFPGQFGVIGNFPYNISSQLLFRVVEFRAQIPELVGMFQREVAQRAVSPEGSKVYGLLSAWLQVFYNTEYLITVQEGAFFPPPKVKSGVIRLTRKADYEPKAPAQLILKMMKSAFTVRRKTLRNGLAPWKPFFEAFPEGVLDKRPEQLSAEGFIALAEAVTKAKAELK